MHFTKPALVAASFLWATTFASPINSPTRLRTRGLIGGSTSDDNTKSIAGSTTAGNAVGSDDTKNASGNNAVEDAVGSLNLDDITGGLSARDDDEDVERNIFDDPQHLIDGVSFSNTRRGIVGDNAGGLTARDVLGRHHGHKSQEGEIVDDALNIADDATPGGIFGRTTRREIGSDDAGSLTDRNALRHHHDHHSHNGEEGSLFGGSGGGNRAGLIVIKSGIGRRGVVGDDAGGPTARDVLGHHRTHNGEGNIIANDAVDGAQETTRGDDLTDAPRGTVEDAVEDDTAGPGFLTGLLRRLVLRDNDGAVHDANKAVHQANEIVHNTLHGLLHGILR
ncbi:uncharacterized protein EAE98_008169 [Botrytis deweyae]|uniref:Uncharacterized protein n=1 Tax=Botrytis deweyae TaxID=2478750 RepID=A0ABQ7IEL8_9HELO|nr:uncharacterized protein EAE98_008169 [Botrytis deweyae]KAF7921958.1 hypothetical protein EAE98_008169 [Botrytis deweyae]